MTRSRLIALHALGLTMTIATMTLVALAASPHTGVQPPVRWVVIGLGLIAAVTSLLFARSALREIERLDRALRQATPLQPPAAPAVFVSPAEQPRLLQ